MKTQILALVLMVTALPAFGSDGGSSTAGVPNPSSKYCADVGGLNDMAVDRDHNQYGICRIGSAIIDTWTLWREKHGDHQVAVKKYLEGKRQLADAETTEQGFETMAFLPNPASTFCLKVGGALQILSQPGGEFGLCRFADGSSIEEWTLFSGPDAEGNAALTKLLRSK